MKKKREYGGRKPLPKNQKKSEAFRIRLTSQEIDKINDLHNKSFHSNFSALIRDILLCKRIEVDVKNIDISSLLSQLETTKKLCSNISRTKGGDDTDFKLLMEDVRNQILQMKSIVESLRKTDLYLKDLKEISDSNKYDDFQYYLMSRVV